MTEERLAKNFSFISLLGLGFAILDTWTAAATSISLALPSGGTSAILWGLLVSGTGSLSIAASLGEIFYVFPRAGGQYRFCALLSSEKQRKFLSFLGGWLSIIGWLCLIGCVGSLTANQIGMTIMLWHENFVLKPWHTYMFYLAMVVTIAVPNFFPRILPAINIAVLWWSLSGVLVIIITCLSCARGNYSEADYVFRNFTNQTGWADGISWILGLLQGVLSLTAYDSVMHMAYEIPDPRKNIPTAMVTAVGMGVASGFIFLMCILFSASDLAAVNESISGPLLEIYYQATHSKVGATCLLVFSFGCLLLGGISTITSSSRMIWVFAKDRGFPFSGIADTVHPVLKVPVGGIIISTIIPALYGIIYIGSNSAFNAILSAAVIFLNFSYVLPIIILVARGRHLLDENSPGRTWTLGRFGYFVNYYAICFVSVTTIFFCFPPAKPVDSVSMNYACVIIGIALLLCAISWFTTGRSEFVGHLTSFDKFEDDSSTPAELTLDQKIMKA